MRTLLITGGTGLVGSALVKLLTKKNYRVIILTRNKNKKSTDSNISYAFWNVEEKQIDVEAVKQADAIIHLAGAGVMDKKWTTAYKKEILESRTRSSELLVDTLRLHVHKVQVVVSASAIGWYGEDKVPGHFFTEGERADGDFLGMVCEAWEQSIAPASQLGIRVVKLRTGIVLSKNGGAYAEFRAPLKFGIAAILGNGSQIISWIHIDDLCRQYLFALENQEADGSYNAVAPTPVTNEALVVQMAKTIKGKFYLPVHVPQMIIKLMLGQRSIEILKSTTVSSAKLEKLGFTFDFAAMAEAVQSIEKG